MVCAHDFTLTNFSKKEVNINIFSNIIENYKSVFLEV